jgi:hypothetical protein
MIAAMKKRASTSRRHRAAKGALTLGRERFAKISAVEGIELTVDMRARAAEFDRLGMAPAKRRHAIIRAYSKG